MSRRARDPGLTLLTRHAAGLAAVCIAACTRSSGPVPSPPLPNAIDASSIRVSLGVVPAVTITATDAWRLVDRDGRVAAEGRAGDMLSLSSQGGTLTLAQPAGARRELAGPVSLVVVRPAAIVSINERRYR